MEGNPALNTMLCMRAPAGLLWNRVVHRVISVVTLLAQGTAPIGFPLSVSGAHTSSSDQQPCCCGSQAQCKVSGCGCCRSQAPAPGAVQEQPEPANCCSAKKQASRTAPRREAEAMEQPLRGRLRRAPSHAQSKEFAESAAPSSATSLDQSIRWVVGMAARRCRGGITTWLTVDLALSGLKVTPWHLFRPFCESIPVKHLLPFLVVADVVDPPPRALAA